MGRGGVVRVWGAVLDRHATSARQGLCDSLGSSPAVCATRYFLPYAHAELSRNLLHPVHRSVGPSSAWLCRAWQTLVASLVLNSFAAFRIYSSRGAQSPVPFTRNEGKAE